MLNELSQVVDSLNRVGVVPLSRHPRINPMGKNKELLVVLLDNTGKPTQLEIVPGSTAEQLFRIEHRSCGSSFPGFNIPTPLRQFNPTDGDRLQPIVLQLRALEKNKSSSNSNIKAILQELYTVSKPFPFSPSQEKQFQRSCAELVLEISGLLPANLPDLKNFYTLLTILVNAKLTLPHFTEAIAELMRDADLTDRKQLLLFKTILFGELDWKNCVLNLSLPEYWKEKQEQDKKANQAVYLDLMSQDLRNYRVAHSETSKFLNTALVQIQTNVPGQAVGLDAFGTVAKLQDKYPGGPKVAELGNVKLFSVNTAEVLALQRYGFKNSQSFPVAEIMVQKMSDALLYLASEDKRSITCQAIPSAQPNKRDLLIAYLEGELGGREQLAEMFGGECSQFSEAHFGEIAKPVIAMLEGKLACNPDLNIRLLALCSIDKSKKQISLNRKLHVRDVIQSVNNWETGACNVPSVSIWFDDKRSKKATFLAHTVPCPLELATVINRVWSTNTMKGFDYTYQRALSVGDAYDIFLADTPLALQKVRRALELLLARMTRVLSTLGTLKVKGSWTSVSDTIRWQSLKSIALLGIMLHRLGYYKKDFMQEPMTQIGRLLALSDSLHLQYCKHMRNGQAPTQLIGNSLFNTALEQPVLALARLAERLTPYQAWARSFYSNNPDAGVGLVKYFLSEMAACTATIKLNDLPQRMTDIDKAKLLLGYLADNSKTDKTAKTITN